MDQIAFIIGDTFLYWNSIILTLAAATAICFFLSFYLENDGSTAAAAAVIPLAMVLSLVLGRLIHWYCRADSYAGIRAAMTNYASGGYALLGCFGGCILAAVLVFALRLEKQLPRMLDAMSLGGCAGIAAGRLACFFSASDRGQILQTVKNLPWAYPVTNAVSGMVEYRLATFVIQAMITGAIFAVLVIFSRLRKGKQGDVTLLFLLLYCASQAVLDSTRYDSLFLRSNGFISVVQLLSAIMVIVISAVFSVRLVKAGGFRKWYPVLWLAIAGLMGGAGYMEYYVQRHGDKAVFSYTNMSICLGLIVVLTAVIYGMERKQSRN